MKKVIANLLVFVMILLAVPVTDAQAADNSKKAYKAYRIPSKYKKYALTDLDGDGTSELVGRYKKEKQYL